MNEIPYDYAEFQRRARRVVQRRRGQRRALAATAVCATLVVIGAAWVSRGPGAHAGADGLLAESQAALQSQSPSQDAMRAASRSLLTDLPAEPAVVQLASSLAVSRLEDRIAVLDDALNEAQFGGDTLASIHSLRSERMQLVDSLVRVRYAERMAAAVR